MIATMMMQPCDHPPGLSDVSGFHPSGRQPYYHDILDMKPPMARYERGMLPTVGPLQMHRTLEESAAARKAVTSFPRASREFPRKQPWRGQPPRAKGAGFPPDGLLSDDPGYRSNVSTQQPGQRGPIAKRKRYNNTYNNSYNYTHQKRKMVDADPTEGAILPGPGHRKNMEFRPPRLHDLSRQNQKNTKKYFHRNKRFKRSSDLTSVPEAPRNTTSFIMRANKLGIMAPAVSPTLPALAVSPSPWASGTAGDQLVEEAKELHVDPYGSMNGCIRLRCSPDLESSGGSDVAVDKETSAESADGTTSSDSVEQVHQVDNQPIVKHEQQEEDRKDDGWQRFDMLYSPGGADCEGRNGNRFLQARVEEQETEIAHLQEENMTLQERLFLVEQELKEFKRRAGEIYNEHADLEGDWSPEDEASCAPSPLLVPCNDV